MTHQTADVSAAISDPGEVDRDVQNRGDRLLVFVGNQVAWLFPVLVAAICAQVLLRGAGMNQAWLDDLQWWLYGVISLVGIGYAVTTGAHVRIDILHNRFPERRKGVIEVFALTWFLLPFLLLCWDLTLPYAVASVVADEGSDSPNGLHNLWILKLLVNASFLVMIIATLASYARHLARLLRPRLHHLLLCALPSTLFGFQVAMDWILVLYLRFAHVDPDTGATLGLRQLRRLPAFEPVATPVGEMAATMLASIALTLVLALASLLRTGLARPGSREG